MTADPLELATASTSKIVADVSREQLDMPTSCASWTVRDLINHIAGNNFWFEAIASTGTAPDRPDNAAPDVTGGDYSATFDTGARRAVEAFAIPGTLDSTLLLPWGEMPAAAFRMMASADQYVHGWDLAKATGQPTDLDPVMAEHFLEFYRAAMSDAFRGPDRVAPFGAVIEVGAGAGPVEQLMAFLGRTP